MLKYENCAMVSDKTQGKACSDTGRGERRSRLYRSEQHLGAIVCRPNMRLCMVERHVGIMYVEPSEAIVTVAEENDDLLQPTSWNLYMKV